MRTRTTLTGRHLVITGFTGFLAKVLVLLLLEEVPEIGRVTLLVRPRGRLRPALRRVEEAFERSPAFRALRQRLGPDLDRWLGDRIQAIDADLERVDCDLSPEALQSLRTADAIVHCAGLTDFSPDPLKALSANTAAAAHVARLAQRLNVPLVHVSTAFAAGGQGQCEVEEKLTVGVAPDGRPLDAGAEIRWLQLACRQPPYRASAADRVQLGMDRARSWGWPNIYTYTKGLAEHALSSMPDLDLTIVRPSIVECARALPFAGWNEGLNTAGPLAWLISTAFRRLPTTPEHRFDVVPVDDVARGLAAITAAAIRGEAGGLFHLASSDHNPFTFDRAVELTGLGMRRWARRHGSTTDRNVLAQLDPIPVAADRQGWLSVDRLLDWAPRVRQALAPEERDRFVPDGLRASADPVLDGWLQRLTGAEGQLERVQTMLELFRPFIHDNDWVFHARRARSLTAREERAFRFDLSDLCWRSYWVDVEYPGLRTWCIPLIDGGEVPEDPPRSPRLRITTPVRQLRVASK
ncbi:MAG: SDR family oxidoreductase [Myxococcales bacterium]|nr:SDR family oxidoreductase [Myxococcales bacterium]